MANMDDYRNQIGLARTEIKNLRQQLTALKHEHQKEIKFIKNKLDELRCANCGDEATSVSSHQSQPNNQAPLLTPDANEVLFKPIGIIETPFQTKRGVPRQPNVVANAKGAVVIDPNVFNNPQHALDGLEEFSHMWIIFHFHKTESTNTPAKVAPPRLGGERCGVFSTRSPHRPCPIGISLVKIESIEGNKVSFLGVDMVNGTPVLDIKPFIPQYDYPAAYAITSLSVFERPPTEGVIDANNMLIALQDNDDDDDTEYVLRSISPRLIDDMAIDAHSSVLFGSAPPSPGNAQSNPPTVSSISDSASEDQPDGAYRAASPEERSNAERGAPDGQERFTPPQAGANTLRGGDVRIAPWISNTPPGYKVRFSEDARERIFELIGERAQMFKTNISCLLAEDPRSQYIKTRYPDHEYNCVLEDLAVTCVFDASTSVCTITTVKHADELD